MGGWGNVIFSEVRNANGECAKSMFPPPLGDSLYILFSRTKMFPSAVTDIQDFNFCSLGASRYPRPHICTELCFWEGINYFWDMYLFCNKYFLGGEYRGYPRVLAHPPFLRIEVRKCTNNDKIVCVALAFVWWSPSGVVEK